MNLTNLRPFFPYIVMKMPGNCTLVCFTKWNRCHNEEKKQTMAKCNQFQKWSGYISTSIFKLSFQCVLQEIQKPPHLTISLSQYGAKIRNINRPWPKSNQLWKWSEYINMPNYQSSNVFKINARKSQIWPVSQSQNIAKMTMTKI